MDAGIEENCGIKFVWNSLPSNRIDSTRIVIPVGFHYTPNKKIDNLQLLEYEPLVCNQCKAIISPLFPYNTKAKIWECQFCKAKVYFPNHYSQFISDTNLPAELLPENTTVEYKLNKKEASWPTFLFVIDTAIEEEELNELKDSIQQVVGAIPPECSVGIITFGNMCNVHEIGYTEFPVCYTFKGDKAYKTIEIQEQLGLLSRQVQGFADQTHTQATNLSSGHPKFIMPLKEAEFTINTFLDDLQPDPWGKKAQERNPRCAGLALHIAVSLLESLSHGEPSRILFFLGGPGTIGEGQIVGKPLVETIRNYTDFEQGNANIKYSKPASEFYEKLTQRALKSNLIIDVFSCCLNQVGLMEMRKAVENTGGYMILTDSFSTMIFKDSIKRMFELDENGNLKMNFKAKLEINTSNPIKVSGAMGHMVSLEQNALNVSEVKIGEGGTRMWLLGGMDNNSTYSFILDVNHTSNINIPKTGYIQLITTYIAGDRSHRIRVTTVNKKIIPDLAPQTAIDEIGASFDQESAAVMIARMCVLRGYTEESREILKWVDKTLIRLMSKFSKYNKDDAKSFKLTQQFNYFPQFMFYLRRSPFIQNFNASPDEVTFYKSTLMRENVSNCTIMIQPILFEYTAENPQASPVHLDIASMKNDVILLLDAFFFVVVWHGDEVCRWREAGFQNESDYENIKLMLDSPQEYAQSIVTERLPVPRFISCDSGSGQERLVKCTVNPSPDSRNKVVEDGFCSDDVSLKVFMEFLKKLAVSS